MCRITAVILLLALQTPAAEKRFIQEDFPSKFLPPTRDITICLPESYATAATRRYPVLYLHDGQNAFSIAGTNIAFGWGSWELDKAADELARAGKMLEIIMVAVNNSPAARYSEYCGSHRAAGSTNLTAFEHYSEFLIRELKPAIDSRYRTLPAQTGVMGSSMGGICSVVLAWEHPDVFPQGASLSGAFMVEQTNFLENVVRPYKGKPKPSRLYLDSGISDFRGGDDGRSLTEALAGELRRIGWTSKDLMLFIDSKPLSPSELEKAGLRRDKWDEAQRSMHNEFYWRLRVWRALTFMFPAEKQAGFHPCGSHLINVAADVRRL